MRAGDARLANERVAILGVAFHVVTMDEAVQRIASLLESGAGQVVTANPEIVMAANEPTPTGEALRRAIANSSLVVADGIGVVMASRLLGTPLPERIPGIELAERALRAAARGKKRVYLLGGRPGVAGEAAARLCERIPGLTIAGVRDGYFGNDDNAAVVEEIARSGADLLLVGMGAPKQEIWIAEHLDELGVNVAIGVGGSLDVFAGRVRRAPATFQRLGLEWAYRLAREPRRIGRMVALPRFVVRVLLERVGAGKA